VKDDHYKIKDGYQFIFLKNQKLIPGPYNIHLLVHVGHWWFFENRF